MVPQKHENQLFPAKFMSAAWFINIIKTFRFQNKGSAYNSRRLHFPLLTLN